MRKAIAMILTVIMMFGTAITVSAKPGYGANVPKASVKKADNRLFTANVRNNEDSAKRNKNNDNNTKNENKQLEKTKATLLEKCGTIEDQLNKLKAYIITDDGKLKIELDRDTADKVLKNIQEALAKINGYKKRINEADTKKELQNIKKELQNHTSRHQTMVKRLTGLTNAGRLKKTYDEVKEIVDKLGKAISRAAGPGINTNNLKAKHNKILKALDEVYKDYMKAVALFCNINDFSKADKSYKDGHKAFIEARNGLHDVLIQTKQLLGELKTGASKAIRKIGSF